MIREVDVPIRTQHDCEDNQTLVSGILSSPADQILSHHSRRHIKDLPLRMHGDFSMDQNGSRNCTLQGVLWPAGMQKVANKSSSTLQIARPNRSEGAMQEDAALTTAVLLPPPYQSITHTIVQLFRRPSFVEM
jgi:hypothetical protein